MLRQDLDRHGPLEARVARLVDLSHPAGADRREDLVGAEAGARSEGHSRNSPPGKAPLTPTLSRRERESDRAAIVTAKLYEAYNIAAQAPRPRSARIW